MVLKKFNNTETMLLVLSKCSNQNEKPLFLKNSYKASIYFAQPP